MPIMSIGQIAEIGTMAFLGAVLARLGWRTTMVIGILGHAFRFTVFALAPFPALVIAINLLHGIAYAFFFATVYIFVDEFFPKDARSSAQGLFNFLILGLGPFVANILWPYLGNEVFKNAAGAVDFQRLFLSVAGLGFAAALVLFLTFRPPVRKEPAPAVAAAACGGRARSVHADEVGIDLLAAELQRDLVALPDGLRLGRPRAEPIPLLFVLAFVPVRGEVPVERVPRRPFDLLELLAVVAVAGLLDLHDAEGPVGDPHDRLLLAHGDLGRDLRVVRMQPTAEILLRSLRRIVLVQVGHDVEAPRISNPQSVRDEVIPFLPHRLAFRLCLVLFRAVRRLNGHEIEPLDPAHQSLRLFVTHRVDPNLQHLPLPFSRENSARHAPLRLSSA
jgi:hypothetical protein